MMIKDELLKHIAETGYNVGFGAKKHFSTFDIVNKTPGLIGFFSFSFGVFALVFDSLSTKFFSAAFLVLGIIGLYISFYDSKKDDYEKAGIALTKLYNSLRRLYSNVKMASEAECNRFTDDLKKIEDEYYECCISKQILFSDWYAHYKFFWQHQIDWVDEQKNFKFFRDKVPLSFSLFVAAIVFSILMCWIKFSHHICSYLVP